MLADNAWLEVDGGERVLLTGDQAISLEQSLDGLDLTGSWQVTADPPEHVPGRSLRVTLVNGSVEHTVTVEAARDLPVDVLDPTPLAFMMMVPWSLFAAHPSYDDAPIVTVLPAAIASGVAAGWARRRVDAQSDTADRDALAVSLGIAGLHALLTTRRIGNPITVEGLQPHPGLGGAFGPLILFALHRERLTSLQQRVAIGCLAGIVAIDIALYPRPPRIRDLLVSVQWDLVAYLPAQGWGEMLAAQAADLGKGFAKERRSAELAGFAAGRQHVVDLVREATLELCSRFDLVAEDMELRDRTEIGRRIDDLNGRVAALQQSTVDAR